MDANGSLKSSAVVVTSVSMPASMKQQVEASARENDRSVSATVRLALRRMLEAEVAR